MMWFHEAGPQTTTVGESDMPLSKHGQGGGREHSPLVKSLYVPWTGPVALTQKPDLSTASRLLASANF